MTDAAGNPTAVRRELGQQALAGLLLGRDQLGLDAEVANRVGGRLTDTGDLDAAEVTGVEEDRVAIQEIFTFERTGLTDAGKVQGRFKHTGVKPLMLERLRIAGIQLPQSVFDEVLEVNM